MGFWGIPEGSALELLDDTLKLRHCTALFTMRFPPWSLPKVGNGGSKRQLVTPGHQPVGGSNVGKRVRLTKKTRPDASSHVIPDPGHPTPRRWKRLRPSSEGVGSEVGVPGTCLRREQAQGHSGLSVQPKGQAHWHWFIFKFIAC